MVIYLQIIIHRIKERKKKKSGCLIRLNQLPQWFQQLFKHIEISISDERKLSASYSITEITINWIKKHDELQNTISSVKKIQ